MAKTDWKFWKGLFIGFLSTSALFITILVGINELSKKAKPQLLKVEDCFLQVDGLQVVEFDLLVNNAGSKDCSVIGIDLIWPDKYKADLDSIKPPLPKTLLTGHTERIEVFGDCRPLEKSKEYGLIRKRWELPPDQNNVEGTIIIKFNTNDTITRKIIFPIP